MTCQRAMHSAVLVPQALLKTQKTLGFAKVILKGQGKVYFLFFFFHAAASMSNITLATILL